MPFGGILQQRFQGNTVNFGSEERFTLGQKRADKRKTRKRRIYRTLILLLIIGAGIFGLYRWRLKSQLEARIDAMRAAGYPVTLEELDQWYSKPRAAENAAYVFLDAISYYVGSAKPELVPIVGQAELPKRTEALPADMKKCVSEFLEDNRQTLDILREAAGIGHCRYPIDFRNGLCVLLPHVDGLRDVARLLGLQAILHAEDGQSAPAVECAKLISLVANSLSQEPLLVSQHSRFNHVRLLVSTTERILNRCTCTDGELVELGRIIIDSVESGALRRSFAGERCLVSSVLRGPELSESWIEGIPPDPVLDVYRAFGLFDRAAIDYLDLTEAWIEIAELPERERLEAAGAWGNEAQKASWTPAFVGYLVCGCSRSIRQDLRTTARLRAAQVGVAIERYRAAKGELPESLSELVPAYLDSVPKDPFDGAEMRFRRLEKGYVVYSIGEDLSDDGGKERITGTGEYWDVTFIVER